MEDVNERTTPIVTVEFIDENGNPVTPGSASYRIDDVGSDTEIRGDTAIVLDSPIISQAEIEWQAEDTSILNETHLYETRRMTVTWIYGSGKTGNTEYLLNIINLKGVTTPSPA